MLNPMHIFKDGRSSFWTGGLADSSSEEDYDSSEEALPRELLRKARSSGVVKSPPLFMRPKQSFLSPTDDAVPVRGSTLAEPRAMQVEQMKCQFELLNVGLALKGALVASTFPMKRFNLLQAIRKLYYPQKCLYIAYLPDHTYHSYLS